MLKDSYLSHMQNVLSLMPTVSQILTEHYSQVQVKNPLRLKVTLNYRVFVKIKTKGKYFRCIMVWGRFSHSEMDEEGNTNIRKRVILKQDRC